MGDRRINPKTEHGLSLKRIAADALAHLVRALLYFLIAFVVGTGAAAMVCVYYGLPLILSMLGGFAVLGVALALSVAA